MTKKRKIDLYDAEHPFRKTAIEIIEAVIEPFINKPINGEEYYRLEDNLTQVINKKLKNLITKKHGV